MSLKVIIITIFLLILIAYVGISSFIAYKLTIPNPSPIKFNKDDIGRGTDVVFKSKDNIQIAGWYFPGTNGKAIMFVHGAGNQNRVNEIYGTPGIAKYFLEKGYTILLFDLRGAGESTQTRISFGQYESLDVASAFEYLKSQEFKPESIGIVSNSLGAIATILASETIKSSGGIVLDSPASVVKPVVSFIMEDEHSIPRFLHPSIYLAAKLLYKIDVDYVRPIDFIAQLNTTPILFLHGENDSLIPPINTEELSSKVSTGERYVFPGAKHVETYKSNPEFYFETVSQFFEKNLK